MPFLMVAACSSNRDQFINFGDYESNIIKIIAKIEEDEKRKSRIEYIQVEVDSTLTFSIYPHYWLFHNTDFHFEGYSLSMSNKISNWSIEDLVSKYKLKNHGIDIEEFTTVSHKLPIDSSITYLIKFGENWRDMINVSAELIEMSGATNSKKIKYSISNLENNY